MKSKNRILFLINTLNGGGAEKVLVNLANGLSGEGYEITIQTLNRGVNENSLRAEVRLRSLVNGKLTRLKDYLVRVFCKLLPYSLQAKYLLRGDFDIKVAYLEGYPTKVIKADRSSAKRVAYVHSDLSKGYTLHKLYSTVLDCQREYDSLNGTAFVSKVAQAGFYKEVGVLKNSVVVHNVMDVDDILYKSKFEPKYRFSDGCIKLIAIGRLSAPKSFDRLIKVINRLNSTGLKIELLILGIGELEHYLKKLAEDLGCNNIKFLGYQSNPYQYMAMSDLMVCSSLYEGYSTTTVEAILLGLPVLTTECAGMDEILDRGKYGVIVKNNEEDLFNGLHKLLSTPNALSELSLRAHERSLQLKTNENLIQNINFLNHAANA